MKSSESMVRQRLQNLTQHQGSQKDLQRAKSAGHTQSSMAKRQSHQKIANVRSPVLKNYMQTMNHVPRITQRKADEHFNSELRKANDSVNSSLSATKIFDLSRKDERSLQIELE